MRRHIMRMMVMLAYQSMKIFFDILPENLLQSIREKERMAMEERNPAISQAKRRQKVIASLPKLFNMIHLVSFNKTFCSHLTKEDLVSKIISSHCDIVDRIEEHLTLLLELVQNGFLRSWHLVGICSSA